MLLRHHVSVQYDVAAQGCAVGEDKSVRRRAKQTFSSPWSVWQIVWPYSEAAVGLLGGRCGFSRLKRPLGGHFLVHQTRCTIGGYVFLRCDDILCDAVTDGKVCAGAGWWFGGGD